MNNITLNSILVGKPAPDIQAKAVVGNTIVDFALRDYLGKYVILFFYPLDFTFVCPTELHAFQEKEAEFVARGAQIVGCSVDSPFSHQAWLQTPKIRGGIEGIQYPLIADLNKNVARDYQVLKEDEGIAYRGLYLIDKKGIIRHQLVNDLPIGRSVDETLRILDAVAYYEQHGDVCPANWKAGMKTMRPNQDGLIAYFG